MKQSYRIVRQAISPDTLDLLKNAVLMYKQIKYYKNNTPEDDVTAYGDKQSPISFSFYNEITFDSLAVSLLPLMEETTGLELFPTYTYGRIYWPGSTLSKHVDRPSCQYSATLCVDVKGKPWPFYIENKKITLQAGDLVVYKGCEVEHWRETYTGEQQIQLFLHYVDANGIYRNYKFDQRPLLGLEKNA